MLKMRDKLIRVERLPLLMRTWERVAGANRIFVMTVVVPTALAIAYYGFLASDVYVSQSQFVVRSPDKPEVTGFGSLLKGAGFSSSDEVYAAQSYIKSRDALRALNQSERFRTSYTRSAISIFDRFNPTGLYGSFENLYYYFLDHVDVNFDSNSSITTLTVRAFNGRDAYRFNEQLLELAEATVNRLNERARIDLIGFAETEVRQANLQAQAAAAALAAFRNRTGVVDPEAQATVQLQMVSKLQDELIASRTQLSEIERYAPANPQIEPLQTRIASLQRQIGDAMEMIAGRQRSLAGVEAQYQHLKLDSELADKKVAAAMTSLTEAQDEARRKQAYVERIEQPNVPDTPTEPRRVRGILTTLILGFVVWGVLSMLLAGIQEHRD